MRWLLDEMLPPVTGELLNQRGHDAISVVEAGLAGAPDAQVFDHAVAEDRIIVTENFADYSVIFNERLGEDQPGVPVVFVRKSDFPQRGALPMHLAAHLDEWARANPEPYVGPHWP